MKYIKNKPNKLVQKSINPVLQISFKVINALFLTQKETLKWVPYFYYRPFFYFHPGIPTKCTSHFKNMRECKMSTEEGRVTSRDRKRTQGDHRRLRSDGRGRVLVTCTQHNDAQEHTSLLPDWPLFLYRCQCHFCLCRAGADVKAQCPTVSRAELLCLMVRRMECGWKTKESLKCPLLLPNDVAEGFFVMQTLGSSHKAVVGPPLLSRLKYPNICSTDWHTWMSRRFNHNTFGDTIICSLQAH